MKKIKVLNLYAGIGGNRKLWDNVEVTAVENVPKIAKIYSDLFPEDKMLVVDAHQYLLDHYKEFDFIWSSPPCPTHSRMKPLQVKSKHKFNIKRTAEYPDMRLYQEILLLKHFFKGKWIVENVVSYYDPLIKPAELYRHYFWSNFHIAECSSHILGIKKRDTIHSTTSELMNHYEIYPDFEKFDTRGLEKDQLVRNCVHPRLALHILKCAFKVKQEVLI